MRCVEIIDCRGERHVTKTNDTLPAEMRKCPVALIFTVARRQVSANRVASGKSLPGLPCAPPAKPFNRRWA